MGTYSPIRQRAAELIGRRHERELFDDLIDGVRAGESRALVMRGEPAVGKTALLEYIVEQASGCYDYVAGKTDRGSFGLPSSGSSWVASSAPHSNATTTGRQTLHDPPPGFLEGLILSSDARDELVLA